MAETVVEVDVTTGARTVRALTAEEQADRAALCAQEASLEQTRRERQTAQEQQRAADTALVLKTFAAVVPDPAAQEALARILEGPG
jgi:hypothetical protein